MTAPSENDAPKPVVAKGANATQVLGVGSLLGFSAGYATKKIGKAALFLCGVGVLAMQVLYLLAEITDCRKSMLLAGSGFSFGPPLHKHTFDF